MKVAATALLLAASVVGTLATGTDFVALPNGGQTVKVSRSIHDRSGRESWDVDPVWSVSPVPPTPPQENVCKGTVKDMLTCSIGSTGYVSATDNWTDQNAAGSCLQKAKPTFEKCRGAAASWKDKVVPGAGEPGHPAYGTCLFVADDGGYVTYLTNTFHVKTKQPSPGRSTSAMVSRHSSLFPPRTARSVCPQACVDHSGWHAWDRHRSDLDSLTLSFP